jgi:3-oxoacyl-[acyl-carrier-protein] synthase-1
MAVPAIAIAASGMVTAVGFNAPASLAAMRAGLRNVKETNLWDAESGTYLGAGRVSLPHWWIGLGKLAELVAPAVQECLSAAQPASPAEVPVLLGVAAPDRPFRFPGMDSDLLKEIEYRLEIRLHPDSRVILRDRVSVVDGLREAGKLIADGKAPCVIVAAVDSLVRQDLVEYYLSRRRLLTPQNSNGFSVGEAGSAVLVTGAGSTPKAELQILGMGLATEKATIESEEPLRALGLTRAIRDALGESELTIEDICYRITDLNGEHYRFKELTLAISRFIRNPKPRPKLFDLWHPIESIGDVGASIGPIALGVALDASHKAYGMGPTVLCTFGNDDGERAAVVLHYHTPEKTA